MSGAIKEGLHPRNRFRTRYDFPQLIACSPALGAFVKPNAYGNASIDYADPLAVKALNQALLRQAYDLEHWDIPPGYLCPPIPGRSDYLYHLADLISVQRGPLIRVLDIGAREYGWSFVGAEHDPAALLWAKKLVSANAGAVGLIECRRQTSALEWFKYAGEKSQCRQQ